MYKTYQQTNFVTYLNEPEHLYRRTKPATRRYIPCNSYNTYQMAKTAIPEKEGCWLMLIDDAGALAHAEKMGDQASGFGEIGAVLQTALRHECLSLVLVSHCDDYYQANSTNMMYNVRLITAACGISMVLLDHLAIEPDGYFSYSDNGLLSYMSN